MALFIICGHGDGDPGAIGNGYQEAQRVRALVERIKALGGESVTVGDTSKNWYKSKLVNNENIPKGSLVLELHMDSAGTSARGGHVIIDADFEADKYDNALADFICEILPGRANKIVKRNDLANLNRAQKYGINYRLLECGFITNAEDVNIFNSRMDEIAEGILSCFGISAGKTKDVNGDGTVTAEDALEMLKKTANMKENPEGYNAEDALDVLKDVANINKTQSEKEILGIVTGDGVRIRSGAGTNYSIIGSVNKGTEVRIWGESGDWYMIDTDKWVSKRYVSVK